MKIAFLLLAFTVLLTGCDRHDRHMVGMGSADCRKATGSTKDPWKLDGNTHKYDFDNIETDLTNAEHNAVCLSQSKNEDILFHSQKRGPFNLIVTPASGSAPQCAVDVALVRDDNGGDCVDKATIKIRNPNAPIDCSYEVFPLFGCKPGGKGTEPGADPHVKLSR